MSYYSEVKLKAGVKIQNKVAEIEAKHGHKLFAKVKDSESDPEFKIYSGIGKWYKTDPMVAEFMRYLEDIEEEDCLNDEPMDIERNFCFLRVGDGIDYQYDDIEYLACSPYMNTTLRVGIIED